MVNNQASPKKCSSIIKGLQFCTTKPKITVNLGEKIIIDVFLRNESDKTITVLNGDLNFSYTILITDSNGRKVNSISEDLAKKVAEKKISADEVQLPLGYPMPRMLEPRTELKARLSVSYFYDLTAQGKYLVKLVRKVPEDINGPRTFELPLAPIEIEIK